MINMIMKIGYSLSFM